MIFFKKRYARFFAICIGLLNSSLSADLEVQELDDSVSMLLDDRVLWTYNHNPKEGKPYFHPLSCIDGTVFTDLRPEDHPWHRGMWFSWKFINGINYWEEDRETGLSQGQTHLLSVERVVSEGKKVTLYLKLSYSPGPAAEPVLLENREIVIDPPDKQGAYRINWKSSFYAQDDDVTLDRTPIPGEPEGKSWGGYAGLSVRMNSEMKGGVFRNSEGKTDAETWAQKARWIAFTSPKKSSISFLDHPSNLRYPSKWYVARGMPYFSPAILFDSSYSLKGNESLTLRYRVIVSPEPIPPNEAESDWKTWSQTDGE